MERMVGWVSKSSLPRPGTEKRPAAGWARSEGARTRPEAHRVRSNLMTDMYDRILRLRAIRNYADQQISDEDLERILQAARWTGSSKNRQSWSWVVIQDPEQRRQLAEAGDFTDPVRNAPTVIALIQEPDGYEMDTGRLAQNIMLAADAVGVASCPITLHREDVAAKVLGLPVGSRCRYAVALGYPGKAAGPAKMGGRKPLVELTHRETYGG